MSRQTYREPDFGAEHGKSQLVIDKRGTVSVAFYENGIWWEGHPKNENGFDATRIQLDRVPDCLFDAEEFA